MPCFARNSSVARSLASMAPVHVRQRLDTLSATVPCEVGRAVNFESLRPIPHCCAVAHSNVLARGQREVKFGLTAAAVLEKGCERGLAARRKPLMQLQGTSTMGAVIDTLQLFVRQHIAACHAQAPHQE